MAFFRGKKENRTLNSETLGSGLRIGVLNYKVFYSESGLGKLWFRFVANWFWSYRKVFFLFKGLISQFSRCIEVGNQLPSREVLIVWFPLLCCYFLLRTCLSVFNRLKVHGNDNAKARGYDRKHIGTDSGSPNTGKMQKQYVSMQYIQCNHLTTNSLGD